MLNANSRRGNARAKLDKSGSLVSLSALGAIDYNVPMRKFRGATVCDWQAANGTLSTTGSTGTGFAFALDSTVLYNGKPTVKCTFQSDATAQTFIGIYTPTNPIRIRDIQTLQIPVLVTSNANGSGGIATGATPLQVWLQTSNSKSIRAQITHANYQSGAWTVFSFGRTSVSVTLNTLAELDAAGVTITSIRIVQGTADANAAANPVWLGEITANARMSRGCVSIVMDGQYTSQYSLLYPLYQRYGIRSSLAIATADMGGSGRMSLAQVQEMDAAGHEVISHTYNSLKTGGYGNATDWPTAADIAEDVQAQWAYLKANGMTRGIGFGVWGFTYGFAATNSLARQKLIAAGLRQGGMMAMRKSVPYNGEAGSGVLLSNPAALSVDPLVIDGAIQISNTHTAAHVTAIIDHAINTGQWAIITVHRSVLSAPGSLEMLQSDFEQWVAYLADKVKSGLVTVEPFGEAATRLGYTG